MLLVTQGLTTGSGWGIEGGCFTLPDLTHHLPKEKSDLTGNSQGVRLSPEMVFKEVVYFRSGGVCDSVVFASHFVPGGLPVEV